MTQQQKTDWLNALKRTQRNYSAGGTLEFNNQVKGWNDCIDHLAQRGMLQGGWVPIDTAPRDGTDVLVMYMHIDTQVVHNAFYANEKDGWEPEDYGWWSYEHNEVSRIKLDDWMTPTHWMPLPAAPKMEGKE